MPLIQNYSYYTQKFYIFDYSKINNEIDLYLANNPNEFLLDNGEYDKENKIDIDLSITMDYFKTISKNMSSLKSSLNKKMPEYIKLNKFLTESKILRESIQSKINDGYEFKIIQIIIMLMILMAQYV